MIARFKTPAQARCQALAPQSDTTFHIVACKFGAVHYFREIDLADADRESVIRDLMVGQFDQPLHVIAFNTFEGWSRDVSEDIAIELTARSYAHDTPLTSQVREFCEFHGVQPSATAPET